MGRDRVVTFTQGHVTALYRRVPRQATAGAAATSSTCAARRCDEGVLDEPVTDALAWDCGCEQNAPRLRSPVLFRDCQDPVSEPRGAQSLQMKAVPACHAVLVPTHRNIAERLATPSQSFSPSINSRPPVTSKVIGGRTFQRMNRDENRCSTEGSVSRIARPENSATANADERPNNLLAYPRHGSGENTMYLKYQRCCIQIHRL